MTTQFGTGDPETWCPCTGHPNDPRTEECQCGECFPCVLWEVEEDTKAAAMELMELRNRYK